MSTAAPDPWIGRCGRHPIERDLTTGDNMLITLATFLAFGSLAAAADSVAAPYWATRRDRIASYVASYEATIAMRAVDALTVR